MLFSTTKLLKINEMHNFLSIILINYLGDFQFRQQVNLNKKLHIGYGIKNLKR